jgi:hypothetical protein
LKVSAACALLNAVLIVAATLILCRSDDRRLSRRNAFRSIQVSDAADTRGAAINNLASYNFSSSNCLIGCDSPLMPTLPRSETPQ